MSSAVSFDSIITADTTALAEDSSAAYRSPESFPPVESCLVLEPFGSNWLKRRDVIKLWTPRGKPRVMPANQYLLFATTDSYERSDTASSLSRQTTHNISRSALCFFLQRQRYPITVLLTAGFRKLDCWSCDVHLAMVLLNHEPAHLGLNLALSTIYNNKRDQIKYFNPSWETEP